MDAITNEFEIEQEPPLPRTLDIDIDITFQKKRFTSLHLEEPTAKQLERAEIELNTASPTAYTMRRYQIALVASVAQVPREVVRRATPQPTDGGVRFFSRTARAFPQGWRDLIADLTRFWGWGPHDAWGLDRNAIDLAGGAVKPHR